MNFERFQALVSVMTNEQFNKLEANVFELLKADRVFSANELRQMDEQLKARNSFKQELVLN